MDWPTYRALCDAPQYFTRWMIDESATLLSSRPLRSALQRALDSDPLEKPGDHKGGAQTDVFRLTLSAAQTQAVLASVRDAIVRGERSTGGRGLGGFEAAWSEYHEWIINQKGGLPMSAEQRVLAMIDGFNRIDLDAIIDCFTEDAIYHNIPMEPVQGQAAIREVLKGFMGAATEVQWDMLNISSNGGTVLTERVDKFKINGTWVELPVMGTFEVDDDRITAWRDYFDMNQFQTQFQAAMS